MAKKKGAKGIIIGIICVIIIAAIVVAVVYFMQGDKKLSDLFNTDNKVELTQEQKEEDNKAKEQEQKLLEEIAKDVEDKKPEDIIIPAGATEEEKQELQQEKEYWTVVKEVKDLINTDGMSYAKNDKSGSDYNDYELGFKSIRQIKAIYYDSSLLYIYCDFLYTSELNSGDTVLKQNSGYIKIEPHDEILDTSYNEIIKVLQDKNTNIVNITNYSGHDDLLEAFFNNHIKNYGTLGMLVNLEGKSIEILDMSCYKNQNSVPIAVSFLVKIFNDESVNYRNYDFRLSIDIRNMTFQQWEDYAKNDTSAYIGNYYEDYNSINFNFEELNEKYQQK